jgi:hypothetical protein
MSLIEWRDGMNYLTKRDGFWAFVRRVSKEYERLDRRVIVRMSTKIRVVDDPRAIRAKEVAAHLNAALEAYWQALALGRPRLEAERHFAVSREMALQSKRSVPDRRLQEFLAEVNKRIDLVEALEKLEARERRLGIKR